jgi:hypothetical protein
MICEVDGLFGINNFTSTSRFQGSMFEARGLPAELQSANEFYAPALTVAETADRAVFLIAFFADLVDREMELPPYVPIPNVQDLSQQYRRLRSTLAIPAAYDADAFFSYSTMDQSVVLVTTNAARGSGPATFELPDFSDVPGWNDSYAPGASESVEWSLRATGSSNGGLCADGARSIEGYVFGTK